MAGNARLPHAMTIEITADDGDISRGFLDDLEAEMLGEFRRLGCLESVQAASSAEAADADLVLRIRLTHWLDELRYEQSLADASGGQRDAEIAMRREAVLAMDVSLDVRLRGDSTPLKDDAFHVRTTWRPRLPGEDARDGARVHTIRDLARKTRKAVCDGLGARIRKRRPSPR